MTIVYMINTRCLYVFVTFFINIKLTPSIVDSTMYACAMSCIYDNLMLLTIYA